MDLLAEMLNIGGRNQINLLSSSQVGSNVESEFCLDRSVRIYKNAIRMQRQKYYVIIIIFYGVKQLCRKRAEYSTKYFFNLFL